MTWGNILQQWTLTPGRGNCQSKAGFSIRSRGYPDSHSGVSESSGPWPGPTPGAGEAPTLVGVTVVQWPGPPAGARSILIRTWASRGHPGLNLLRSRDLSPGLRFSLPSCGAFTLSCAGSGGAATGAGPPCSPAACPAVTCSGGRRGRDEMGRGLPEPGRHSRGPTDADGVFPIRDVAPLEPPLSPAPTPCATPARARLCVSTSRHFLVPPSRRPPGPALSRLPVVRATRTTPAGELQALGGRHRQGSAQGPPGASDHGAPQ